MEVTVNMSHIKPPYSLCGAPSGALLWNVAVVNFCVSHRLVRDVKKQLDLKYGVTLNIFSQRSVCHCQEINWMRIHDNTVRLCIALSGLLWTELWSRINFDLAHFLQLRRVLHCFLRIYDAAACLLPDTKCILFSKIFIKVRFHDRVHSTVTV